MQYLIPQKHISIMEEKKLLGMLSIGNMVNYIID